jgi:hypothetical protein
MKPAAVGYRVSYKIFSNIIAGIFASIAGILPVRELFYFSRS